MVQHQHTGGHTFLASLLTPSRLRAWQVLHEAADEWLCPITTELPLDPVTAEDGHVYERSAIEAWFATRPEPQVKSPMINETMGKKLLPAVQVKSAIEKMVKSGAICGDKAERWTERLREEEEAKELRRRAEGGPERGERGKAPCGAHITTT